MCVEIKNFKKMYQNQVKSLILQGLKDHWGFIDYTKNPDLNNIEKSYNNETFLTAWIGSNLVGTGALLYKETNIYQIVRMSVDKKFRRKKIGTKILEALIIEAKNKNLKKVILETTKHWNYVILFYQSFGFSITEYKDDECYLELIL